jgi:hypothetical protein
VAVIQHLSRLSLFTTTGLFALPIHQRETAARAQAAQALVRRVAWVGVEQGPVRETIAAARRPWMEEIVPFVVVAAVVVVVILIGQHPTASAVESASAAPATATTAAATAAAAAATAAAEKAAAATAAEKVKPEFIATAEQAIVVVPATATAAAAAAAAAEQRAHDLVGREPHRCAVPPRHERDGQRLPIGGRAGTHPCGGRASRATPTLEVGKSKMYVNLPKIPKIPKIRQS